MRKEAQPDFFGRTRDELVELLHSECGVSERFRADQVYAWLYARRITSFQEMSNLPRSLQHTLQEKFSIPKLEVRHVSRSADGTKKFLFALEDGRSIETVLIPSEMRDDRS